MSISFAVTFDYRCPFACNAHDRVVDAVEAGAPWAVRFSPFSLGQVHVGDGEPDVWDDPATDTGLLALQVGVAVRDDQPDAFLRTHRELFAVRHRHALSLNDEAALADALIRGGASVERAFELVATGSPLETVRKEHEAAVSQHDVWGVPTFIVGERAVFVRLNTSAAEDPDPRRTIERIVDMVTGWPELNEFKHTTLDR